LIDSIAYKRPLEAADLIGGSRGGSNICFVSTILLRRDGEILNPLDLVLEFLETYGAGTFSSRPASFDESDLRRANRGGARISAAEISAILGRRGEIERALRQIDAHASLAGTSSSIPWAPLTLLFDAFADIRGVGFSKMTKALHPKRPALVPILDSVVQAYLAEDDVPAGFADRATALVRGYKRELDANHSALLELKRELASRGYQLTEVRILDVLIWSAFSA
jgi:Family of unknown function (DUF6308)